MSVDQHEAALHNRADCHAPLRVVVAMRNEVSRWGLLSMLEALPMVSASHGCGGAAEAAAILVQSGCDVLIVSADLALTEYDSIHEPIEQTGTKILLLLRGSDDQDLSYVVGFNADGYLLESDVTPQGLAVALTRLLNGEMPMPTTLARELLARLRRRGRGPAERPFLLTAREQQALCLLAEGLSNKQIARRLGISEHGAKRHVANVLAKLNCPNRTLAVALALRDGLVIDN